MHGWVQDVPAGPLKNRSLSGKIRRRSVEDAKFLPFAEPEPGFGKKKGDTHTITRLGRLTEPTNPRLNELQRVPSYTYSVATTSVTIAEWGGAVGYTSLEQDLANYNPENEVQAMLGDQQTLSIDTAVAAAMLLGQIVYTPTGTAAGSFATSGTPGAQATVNLHMYHLREVADYLYDDLYAKPWEGENYIGIFRTLALTGVLRDPEWTEWHKYTNPDARFRDEAGMVSNIRLIKTNHSQALGKIGAGSVLGEGVVFGRDYVALVEAMSPELRAESADFGRANEVAWLGEMEMGIIWPTGNAGEAKGVVFGST
jgi:N4-gp56 family major capsid protein